MTELMTELTVSALRNAIRVADETHLKCGAKYQWRRLWSVVDVIWHDGLICNMEPGHSGDHGRWYKDYEEDEWNVWQCTGPHLEIVTRWQDDTKWGEGSRSSPICRGHPKR